MSHTSGLSALTPPGIPSSKHRSTFVWTPVFPENLVTPCMRSKHAACVANNFIYVFGGRDAHSSRKDLWRYNITTNVWTSLECFGTAPPLLQNHTMVHYNDKIYIFGGELGFGTSDETPLWSYDLLHMSWEKEVGGTEVMKPLGRRGHTATLANGVMYIYGGYLDLKGSSSELWLYDFKSESWHIDCLSQLNEPPARHNHSAILHNNSIWIYGGLSNLVPKADLWKWDTDARKWLRIRFHQGPSSLNGHSACAHNDCMFIFGGEDGSDIVRNELWLFSFVTHNWSKISPFQEILPSPSLHHTLLPILKEIHSDRSPVVQYRTSSVPFLHGNKSINNVSPPRPYSSPPIDRNSSPYGGETTRLFQNRVHPYPSKLLSPEAAENQTIDNQNADGDCSSAEVILFHKQKLDFQCKEKQDVEQIEDKCVLNKNGQIDDNENSVNITQNICEKCGHQVSNSITSEQYDDCQLCVSKTDANKKAAYKTLRPDSLTLLNAESKRQTYSEIQVVDLEDDADFLAFTERTKLLSLQEHSKIYQADETNGFCNSGYDSTEYYPGTNDQRSTNITREIYANSSRTGSFDKQNGVNNHQRNMLIPKIVEPKKARQYERSNTLQDNDKRNGDCEWYLAKNQQGQYLCGKQGSEIVLCMYLIGGKECSSNSIAGLKTPLAMWKCAMIPGKPSPQQIRKLMADMTS
ncbi:uncharacterized protein LOC117104195 [Anneissia japonica]|uniref:uncharacterized protein LOC117104195 n=1 Tax=Anneissia japonica TaxID=1529436 RepID=UPI001425928A|nr:uncharacterized protein LOC117104195 [Anneissia japonica]XP_033100789.1 uncharacterized protein LOC117104195 [Anneissia japonica]